MSAFLLGGYLALTSFVKSKRCFGYNIPVETVSEFLQRLLPFQFCHYRQFWLTVIVTSKTSGWEKWLKWKVRCSTYTLLWKWACCACFIHQFEVWDHFITACGCGVQEQSFQNNSKLFRWEIRLVQSLFIFLFVKLWKKYNEGLNRW